MKKDIIKKIEHLRNEIEGEIKTDITSRIIYATDASAYREIPLAVFYPKTIEDIKKLILFAGKYSIGIIPRTAGTSLAGQVVGNGIVVDVSKHLNKIIEVNKEEKWVRVQPGVILTELNQHLKSYGLFFGPETSTANRCMIGGMVGNNACGAHSLIYGSTRDHTLELKTILSDGSEALFKALNNNEFKKKLSLDNFEGELYKKVYDTLKSKPVLNEIDSEYPDPRIRRRNTGYAIDVLSHSSAFDRGEEKFNFCKLLAGSEGTLAFTTEIKLNLVDLPPKEKALLCVHLNSLEDALHANLVAIKHNPGAIELMDKEILECTKGNIEQNKNRFFIQGDPKAILIIEFARETKEILEKDINNLVSALKNKSFGYHYPVIEASLMQKVWDLRKAGLGVLSNMPGDAKPVSVIEDTAVHPDHLPVYIADFKVMLSELNLKCVYHAHIGTGELHLRPVLNLKDKNDVEKFRIIARRTAELVKKYRGSLSGEHGDGRLRGEFIPIIIGEKNYELVKQIKDIWDPKGILNPEKIVNTPAMNESLRYDVNTEIKKLSEYFYYSEGSALQLAEKCNGSGDCRKTIFTRPGMCPSYQATLDEDKTTRARANILREFLTRSNKSNPFNHKEIYNILDLCLSCKACKTECPSGVDVAKLKAEFLQHYYDANRVPLRTWLIANLTKVNAFFQPVAPLYNVIINSRILGWVGKRMIGFSSKRSLPVLQRISLRRVYFKSIKNSNRTNKTVCFFNDEFTNYLDVEIGVKAIILLQNLGYNVQLIEHYESGRSYISKGLLRKAKDLANKNVTLFSELIHSEIPLVGLEPSAILTFRDEYPDLVDDELRNKAVELAKNVFTIEEFLSNEIDNGAIVKESFSSEVKEIKYHGHCQQKAVSSVDPALKLLSFPENYSVKLINSGCCGMAGSFGYEKEHYELSMKIGELTLFPEIRNTSEKTLITASGTSCRHQIKDGTQRQAQHPVEVLYEALLEKN